MSNLISSQAAIDALCDNCDHVEAVCPHYPCKQYIAIENLPSVQPESTADAEFWRKRADYYSDMCSKLIADMGAGVKIEAVKIDETGITFTKKKPSEQPDRSLWFRIGEICVDESKGFISAGRAIEKIRELLRETERSGEGVE